MKKTLSLALIAISIFFLACNKEEEIEKINEIVEVESTGKVAEEVESEQVKEEVKIEEKTTVKEEAKEEVVTETKVETKVETPVITVKSFSMTAQKWSFSPTTITVNKGDTVKISINSTDVTHGFFLSEFGVSENLNAGTTTNVSFVADKSGSFSFTCSVFCGSGHSNMVGTLIVK